MPTLTARTQEEIVARIEERKDDDFGGFEVDEYIDYFDFEHARPYLKSDATQEQWEKHLTMVLAPKERIANYMPFAFEKAHGQRGISANRSIMHMIAWAWLSGDESLLAFIVDSFRDNYSDYGLPILRGICERLKIDPADHGDC